MLVTDYSTYFENLAISHTAIGHVTGDDPGLGLKRFATYNVEDVISKQLRTKVGFPALLLEVYEYSLHGDNVYDAKKEYAGAFTVLEHAGANNPAEEMRALALAETIMNQLIQKLWFDHYGPGYDSCQTPFQYLNLNGANCVPVGPVFDNEFGWRFEFSFRPKDNATLFQAPKEGVFI